MAAASGEPTTVLDEEMLESSPGRARVEATLRDLLGRGLLTTERAINAGLPGRSDGERVFEDDWWCMTKAGRAAIGLLPRGDEAA
jgi:hypothetical protein